MDSNYHIWNEAYLNDLDVTEEYILENSCLPKYQWVEDTLMPCDDVQQFIRLRDIRSNLKDFLIGEFNDDCLNNLLLCSENLGNGKTSWAVKLMLTYIEMQKGKLNRVEERLVTVDNYDYCVFCQSVPFLIETKQFSGKKDNYAMYNRLCKTRLAVIDDLGAVPLSQYDYNIIYAIFEKRLFAGLPTIITTNFADRKLAEKELGPRLVDRIWNNSEIIEFKNKGFRGV